MRGYTIHAFRTLHDGKPYEGESHLSYLITSNGQNLWISGDAVFTSEDVERVNRIAGEREIDAAFVMVYQIGNRARQQILKGLHAKRFLLYHLPYEEDDAYHFRRTSARLVEKMIAEGWKIHILEHDQFAAY